MYGARFLVVATGLALSVATTSAQVVKTILNNGPTPSRYDFVILGDGYRAVDQAKFDADCLRFITGMLQIEPYKTYGDYINAHTVFRASREAGVDHPERNPPVYKDTAYDGTYNTGGTVRCTTIRNSTQALRDAALAPSVDGRVLVLFNDPQYGGCAGQFAVSYNGPSMVQVQTHEVGHSLGRLADEYWSNGRTYTGGEPAQVNATKSSTGAKWSIWRGFNGVSAFEGARYYQYGLWRPKSNCLMRSLGVPLCPICGENIVKELHRGATGITAPLPATQSVSLTQPARQAFSFTNKAPASANAAITWRVDGQVVASGVTSFTFDSSAQTLGQHTVEVELLDRSAFVRRDSENLMRQRHRWTVDVRSSVQKPDLRVTDLRINNASPLGGSSVRMSVVVLNGGPVGAPAHEVNLYLSSDATIDAGDHLLGRYPIAAIPSGQTGSAFSFAVQLPSFLPAGSYHFGAYADQRGVIDEIDETNNTRSVPIQLGATPCGPVLEFRDVDVYPRDTAELSLGTAGSDLRPTVIDRCRPGARYVVVWGCSGTQPGTPLDLLRPGLRLPLNLDQCTTVGLSLANTPSFVGASGALDGQGVGRATFRLPGVPYVRDLPTHFAAILFDAPASVTNAVVMKIVR